MPNDPAPATVRPRRGLRLAIFAILGLVILLIAAVAWFVTAPPASLLTQVLTDRVAAATGRALKVGNAQYTLRPDLVVHLEDVTLSSPQGMAGPDLLHAQSLDIHVELAPLLRGSVSPVGLTIQRPTLNLYKDASGRANWVIEGSSPVNLANHLSISQSALSDGTVNYHDEQGGRALEVDGVTAVLTSSGNSLKAKISGGTTFHAEPAKLDIGIDDVASLARGGTSNISANLSTRQLNATFTGNLSAAGSGGLDGAVTANTASAAELAKWLGYGPINGARLGAVSVTGRLNATPTVIALEKSQVALDGANGVWDVRLDLTNKKPALTVNISAPLLDLGQLTGRDAAQGVSVTSPTQPAISITSGWQSLASDLDKLESRASPGLATAPEQAAPAAAPSIWGNERLDLTGLDALDMDIKTQAQTMRFGHLETKQSVVEVVIRDGKLNASVQQLDIGDGHVKATLDLVPSAAKKPAQASVTLGLDNVAIDPILSEFLNSAPVAGPLKLDVSLKGQGLTERDLVSSLQGQASFTLGHGAVKGFDLRSIVLEWWQHWTYDASRQTQFSALEGRYEITKGVLSNAVDTVFHGTDVEVSSRGNVSLPTGGLDQKVRLQLAPPPSHLPIPLTVGGTWSSPSVAFDWLGVFQDPAALASPAQVAPSTEPMPADLRQRIQNLLSADPATSKLTPAARELLTSMVSAQAASTGSQVEKH